MGQGDARGTRANALWGRSGKRRLLIGAVAALVLALPMVAAAAPPSGQPGVPSADTLAGLAATEPNAVFQVIVQGTTADAAEHAVAAHVGGHGPGATRRFSSIPGVAANLTGAQLVALSHDPNVTVTQDVSLVPTDYSNDGLWTSTTSLGSAWDRASSSAPTIAVIDSGVDPMSPSFGGRLVAQVNMTSLTPNSPGDGRGHGTMVAALAASAASDHAGAAPTSKIASLDVMNDYGMAMTSDVIAACDWILKNKSTYNIRVANLSLTSVAQSSFQNDPLDKAVERLWLNGVVVVTAAGNYAVNGQPSGVLYAPANDPFVITVGAADQNNTSSPSDDFQAPWSANGYTPDGFLKPDLGAPGRYLVAAVPVGAAMPAEHPERIVGPGYLWMSGTSFSSPIVAGIAADLIAAHPTWTPDQVKGALMVSASPYSASAGRSLGVGIVSAGRMYGVTTPPNPNAGLDRFVISGASGPMFDTASWAAAAASDPSWDNAAWNSASWSAASWGAASWGSASWSAASWASASWGDASWAASATGSASWGELSWLP